VAVQIVGVSLQPEVLSVLDGLAQADGLARSALIARLIEAEVERRSRKPGVVEVLVEGVRYVPVRAGRR
jgi:metal-responsive CopG/Arc/MetJ family transcriptional regulator